MVPDSITRRRLLGVAAGATASLSGCATLRPDASFPAGDWPQVARDATNTAAAPDGAVPADVEVAWDAPLRGWPYTSPVVGDGRVFVADADALYGLDAETGDERFATTLPAEPGGAPAYDAAVEAVYVPTDDRAPDGPGAFVDAVDATSGDRRWSCRVGDRAAYAVTVRDGIVYVRTSDAVVALAGGEVRWRRDGLDPLAYPEYNLDDSPDVTGTTAPAVTAESVYVPTNGGVLALDRGSGDRRWDADVSHALAVSVDARGVYAQGYTQLRAFAHDGAPRWSRDDVGGTSAPSLTGEAVIAKDGDTVRELDPESGEDRWSFDLRTTVFSSPSPVVGDVVIAPSHRAVAIRRGAGVEPALFGRAYWETEFDPAEFVAPAVGAGHLLLVDPFRRRLVALEGA